MWLEHGTAKSLVCRYNEQHRQGLQSNSVSAAPSLWVDYALCTIGAWGGDNGYAGKGCVGGEENTGTHHAVGRAVSKCDE